MPLVILTNDSFSAKLTLLGSDPEVSFTYPITTPVTGTNDADNGKITLVIPAADGANGAGSGTDNLLTDKGGKVDRYYVRPTYKLTLDCTTNNNGNFIAKVPEVYVD